MSEYPSRTRNRRCKSDIRDHSQREGKTKSPADTDEEKLKRVEVNLSTFTRKIDATILLPHLKPCLPHNQYVHVRRQCERGESPLTVNQLLWRYLKRAPDWWQYLEPALDKCGLPDLLDIMQE